MAEQVPQILNYDIVAYLGDTLVCTIGWKDATGAYVNFTGCTGLGQIKVQKTDTVPVANFTIVLGSAAGNIQYSLTSAQVAALGLGKWVYDIQITHPDGTVRTYVAGKLKTEQDVTR